MIDFEMASMNAIHGVFPNAIVQGCSYHLSQSIYHKVQNSGLQFDDQNNPDLNISIRMLAALAFVPLDDINDAFETLAEFMPEAAQSVADYFEDTYIGRPHRRGRRPPVFPQPMWNVKNRVEGGLPRTNNHIEGSQQTPNILLTF